MKKFLFIIHWIYNKCPDAIPYITLLIVTGSIDSSVSVNIALITKYLIDSITNSNIDKLKKYLIILASLLFINLILSCLQTIINTLGYEKSRNQIQQKIYNHLILGRLSDISKYHSVELLTRITNDTETISNVLIDVLPNIFSFSVMFIYSFFALLKISKQMAFIAVTLFPILIFISKIYGRKLNHFYLETQKKQVDYNRFLQESFNNISIIKSFCLENIQKRELSKLQKHRLYISLKRSYLSCISNTFFSLSSMISYFYIFIWFSFNSSQNNFIANFGSLVAILQLFSNIQTPISGLGSAFPRLISILGAISRLNELEGVLLENDILASYNNNDYNLIQESINFSNIHLELKNITFEYGYNKQILDNISFDINPGEIVILTGSSGEGKTTLIKLILSLLYPQKGEIYINQHKLLPFHRQFISYVPQGNTLFSDSILNNLTLGNSNITHDEIIAALKASDSYNFVYGLDNDLNTPIGENGLGISEGQAQRLAIARALLRKKPILILDEATSSLDSQTELKVLEEITKLKPKPICILITHRASALRICDRILKLENKKIIIDKKNELWQKNILA